MSDHIKDPLVRLAFEARRRVQELENGVQIAERDLAAAQNGLEQAMTSHAITKAELTAVMDLLTDEQQSDLILEELMHHQQTAATMNPVINVLINSGFAVSTKGPRNRFRFENPVDLVDDTNQETTLVVTRKKK